MNNVDLILGIKVGKLSIEVFKAATSLILSASDNVLGLKMLPTMGQLKKRPLSGLALKKSVSIFVSKYWAVFIRLMSTILTCSLVKSGKVMLASSDLCYINFSSVSYMNVPLALGKLVLKSQVPAPASL